MSEKITDAHEHTVRSLGPRLAEIRPKLVELDLDDDQEIIVEAISALETAVNDAESSIEEIEDEASDDEDE